MPLLLRLSSLWRNLFRKSRQDQELTKKIDAYLERLVEQKINEGLDPAEARRAALIELGGREQVKEKVRDARAGHHLETLWLDLRYALRMLSRNPGFAAVTVLTLGLGIGANTAIFSLMDALLFKMLPFKNPEKLFFLEKGGVPPSPKPSRKLSYAFFEQLGAQREVLAGVCAFASNPRVNVVVDGQAEVADVQLVCRVQLQLYVPRQVVTQSHIHRRNYCHSVWALNAYARTAA
jgi:hypothetical protein